MHGIQFLVSGSCLQVWDGTRRLTLRSKTLNREVRKGFAKVAKKSEIEIQTLTRNIAMLAAVESEPSRVRELSEAVFCRGSSF